MLRAQKGNASQEVLLLRGWLKFSARAKYRFATINVSSFLPSSSLPLKEPP
jgi:hypothetical protein